MRSAFQAALTLLARREYAAQELVRKLNKLGYPKAEVMEALTQVQAKGYQQDSRFVEMLCRTRIRQGYGPLRIVRELNMHGIRITPSEIRFEGAPVDWVACATTLLKKKQKSANIEAQKRCLMVRGFTLDTLREIT